MVIKFSANLVINNNGNAYYIVLVLLIITARSSGISIGCNGGTFAPPVLPTGIFPTNDFTPQTTTVEFAQQLPSSFLF